MHCTETEADDDITHRHLTGPVLRARNTLTTRTEKELRCGRVPRLILIGAIPIRLQPSEALPEKTIDALVMRGAQIRRAETRNVE